MGRHVDALLLDFDGTLADTAPDVIEALNRVLDDMGRERVEFARFRQHSGAGAKRLVLHTFAVRGEPLDDDTARPLVRRLLAHYDAIQTDRACPFPHVVETLEMLRSAGVALAVCTNRGDASTRALLAHFGIDHLFGAILAGDRVTQMKPHPDHLHEALAALGVGLERAVMVGDSSADIDAARSAGLPAIAAAYGYSPVPASTLGADAVIDCFSQIPDTVGRLFQAGAAPRPRS